jgi:low temperature requirement protein LtrA
MGAMAAGAESGRPHRSATLREEERVTPLELFFDLVFVLAITQCTALMSADSGWDGLIRGLLVLGMLWWAWVGYAWLTSVVDPEAGATRLVIFGAMAALLIVSLSVPHAFGSLALTFALAYGAVRIAHIALFLFASTDDDALRHAVIGGLVTSTAVAIGLLALASHFDGVAQGALWALALFLDMAGPYAFEPSGWRLAPSHFAERHGLIIIIALGESIVAIGVGAAGQLSFGIGVVAVMGVSLSAALWWIYFDVGAIISGRRLVEAEPGQDQNALARDSYSYIHLLLVAGIVLLALGLKKTIGHFGDHLHPETAFALLGGVAVYLIGLVAFRYRHIHTVNRRRLGLAVVLLLLVPVATEVPALLTLAVANVLIWALIAYETRSYGEARARLRRPGDEAAPA